MQALPRLQKPYPISLMDGLCPVYPEISQVVGWKMAPYVKAYKWRRDPVRPAIKAHVWIVIDGLGHFEICCAEVFLSRRKGTWDVRHYTDNNCPYGDAPSQWKPFLVRKKTSVIRNNRWEKDVPTVAFLNSRDDWRDCVRIAHRKGWKTNEPIQRYL